jgi:hypothetical protein
MDAPVRTQSVYGGLLILPIAAMLAVAGCGSRPCTLAGCRSGVVFHLAGVDLDATTVYRLDVCLDGACSTVSVRDEAATGPEPDEVYGVLNVETNAMTVRFPSGERADSVVVSFQLRDAGGGLVAGFDGDVDLTRTSPNGDRCGPICFSGDMVVTG